MSNNCLITSKLKQHSTINRQIVDVFYIEDYLRIARVAEARKLTDDVFKHNIDFTEILNEIHFSKDEIRLYQQKFKLTSSFSLINPVGKDSYTPNKNWGFENFQHLVKFSNNIIWIQV